MPQQQAQPAVMELPEEAKRELAQLKKLQAELQEAQAEQTRMAQEQQAQLQAAQVAQMEELRRQNEELRTAMAAQYDRLQDEQKLMHQKMAAELADQPVAAQEELQRKMAEQYERLQHEQEMMQQRLEGQQRLVAGALNQQGDTAQASVAPLPGSRRGDRHCRRRQHRLHRKGRRNQSSQRQHVKAVPQRRLVHPQPLDSQRPPAAQILPSASPCCVHRTSILRTTPPSDQNCLYLHRGGSSARASADARCCHSCCGRRTLYCRPRLEPAH